MRLEMRFLRVTQLLSLLFLLSAFNTRLTLSTLAAGEPLAEVNGIAITSEEVDKPLAPQLNKLEEQIYNLKRQRIDALINERLLAEEAKKRSISVPALMDAEVTSKVGLVTEQEIENFYQANKARYPGEESAAREQIRSFLQNQKLQARRELFSSLYEQ